MKTYLMITAILLGCKGEYSSPTAPPPVVSTPPTTTAQPPPVPPPAIATYQSSSFWQVTALSATEPAISYVCPGRLIITEENGSSFGGTVVIDSAGGCEYHSYFVSGGHSLPDGSIQFQLVDADYGGIGDIFASGPNGPYCKIIEGDTLFRGTIVAGTLDARGQLTVDCPVVGRRDLTVRVTGTR